MSAPETQPESPIPHHGNVFGKIIIVVLIVLGFVLSFVLGTQMGTTTVATGTVTNTGNVAVNPSASGTQTPVPYPSRSSTNIALPKGVTSPTTGYVFGDENAPTHVQIWADLQCPYCAQFEQDTSGPQKESLDLGKSSVEYRYISYIGQGSMDAGSALGCASDQGKFEEFKNYAYSHQHPRGTEFTIPELLGFAKPIGIPDVKAYADCVTSGKYNQYVLSMTDEAVRKTVKGTPLVLVNNVSALDAQGKLDFPAFLTAIGLPTDSWVKRTGSEKVN